MGQEAGPRRPDPPVPVFRDWPALPVNLPAGFAGRVRR